MKSICVTGGNGYVGRELVKQLSQEPDVSIHVIDNLDSGLHRLDAMDQSKFTLHKVDIRDREAVAKAMMAINPELIFHLAAIHYIPLCERNPGNAVNVNVGGTVNLLENAPKGAKFVFASTAAIYAVEDAPLEEGRSVEQPIDIYGWTKYQGENFVKYYTGNGHVRGVIVRLFNVVGPGETNPHLAPDIIKQLSDGVTKVKLGNLFPHRDYIDVADAARGFRALAAVEYNGDGALCSNLGTGRSHEVGDVVRFIAEAAGVDLQIEQDESRVRAVDRPMLKASTKRLRALTGWSPQILLKESLQRAWAARVQDRLG